MIFKFKSYFFDINAAEAGMFCHGPYKIKKRISIKEKRSEKRMVLWKIRGR